MASEESLDTSVESEEKAFKTSIEDISVNSIVEAKDKYENWFIAKVVDVDEANKEVKVHFAGWGNRFDEWVSVEAKRLRDPGPNAEERFHKKREKKTLRVGDRVQTKWEDNRLYLGHIVKIIDSDRAVIRFDDGVEVTRPLHSVRRRLIDKSTSKSSEELEKKEACLQALAEARLKRARKRRKNEETTTDDLSSPLSSPRPPRLRRKAWLRAPPISEDETEEDGTYSRGDSDLESMDCDSAHPLSYRPHPPTKDLSDESPIPNKDSVIKETNEEAESIKEAESTELFKEAGSSVDLIKEAGSTKGAESKTRLFSSDTSISSQKILRKYKRKRGLERSKDQKKVLLTSTMDTDSNTTQSTVAPPTCSILPAVTTDTSPPDVAMDTSGVVMDTVSNANDHQLKTEVTSSTVTLGVSKKLSGRPRKARHSLEKGEEWKKKKMSTRLMIKKNVIKSDKEMRPGHLAPKEHVVILEHNKFKCHFSSCNKSFRKGILLNAHLKHYHNVQMDRPKSKATIKNGGKPEKQTPAKKTETPKKDSPLSQDVKPKTTPKTKTSPAHTLASPDQQSTISTNETQPHSHSATPRKGTKAAKSKDLKTPKGDLQLFPCPPKLHVPPEEKADLVYTQMKNHDLSDIIKVENSELFRNRGKLRPLRKSSHGSNLDLIETESEETLGETTEEEGEELEEGVAGGNAPIHRRTGKGDVVHCNCGNNVDEGFMIQCEQCLTWQHGGCVRIRDDHAPKQYICPTCSNPPGRRNRITHKFQREWFTRGALPTLSKGLEAPPTRQRAVLHAHKLADVLCRLKKMVHCTKIKLDAAKSVNHNYMKHWIKQCSHLCPSDIHNYLMKLLTPVMKDIPLSDHEDDGVGVVDVTMETNHVDLDTPQIDALFKNEELSCNTTPTLPSDPSFFSHSNLPDLSSLPRPHQAPPTFTDQSLREDNAINGTETNNTDHTPATPIDHTPAMPLDHTPAMPSQIHIALHLNQSQSIDDSPTHSVPINGHDSNVSQTTRVSSVVKGLSEKIVKGEGSTQWLYRILLLDHIDLVQQKMVKCLDEVDQQIEALSPSDLKDHEKLLLDVQKSISDFQKIRQSTS